MRLNPARALTALLAVGTICACSGHGGSGGSLLPATAHVRAFATTLSYDQVVLADAPTAYYRLDDTTTVAKDSSGNAIDGTVGSGVVENAPGLLQTSSDTAMRFPGTATSAGIVATKQSTLLQPTTNVSLEAWFSFGTIPTLYTVIAAYGSDTNYAPYDLFFRSNGTLVGQIFTNGGVLEVIDPKALAINTVYHAVLTYDGSTSRLYVNGALVATATKSGTIAGYLSGYGFSIGDDAAVADPAFKGTIDEVAVYANKVLTAAQVQNHYAAGTTGVVVTPTPSPTPTPTGGGSQYPAVILADGPTAYYRLDDTGSTAVDATGRGYNGTIGSSVIKSAPGLLPIDSDTAMSFPGIASDAGIVSFPQNTALQPGSAVTLESWLRFATTPPLYTVVVAYGTDSFYAPYDLFFRSGGTLVAQFFLNTGLLEVTDPAPLAANTTYYVASTYDGTTGRLYVNGTLVASGTKSGTLSDYTAGYGLAIGDDAAKSDPAFKGTIDEVAVYAGKTLSATQVQNHYLAGTGSVTPPPPTPTPSPTPAPGHDWGTMGYDLQRGGYNPDEHTLGAGNVSGIHALWSAPYTLSGGMVGEPMYASNVTIGSQVVNVLYAASQTGVVAALNADTGTLIWSKQLGTAQFSCNGGTYTFGSDGAPTLDRANNLVYVPDGQDQIHALDLATGAEASGWPITIATTPSHNFIYGGLTLNPANHMLYAETSSTCDISPWYGRIVAIDTSTHAIVNTFYPTQGASGGGIWGFGGASVDPSTNHVFIAVGNADTSPGTNNTNEALYYAEAIVELSADVSTVYASNHPPLGASSDRDFGATPLLFQPPGCPPLLAAVNKSGVFVLYDRSQIASGPTQTIAMSIATDAGDFIGVPAYDPVTNYVYIGLPSTFGIYKPGAGAFSISNCKLNPTPVWNAQFGADGATTTNDTPRSPITIANGVVYIADYDTAAIRAFDASSGATLWSFTATAKEPVGPIVTNGHLYTSDITGKLYGWTP